MVGLNRLRRQIDLRPWAKYIEYGTVLFLNDDNIARSLREGTGLHRKALGHPCVVVSPPQDCDYVRIILLTTFGKRRIESRVKREYWQDYLAVAPTPCHPTYPDIQLRITNTTWQSGGYLNVVERYWVRWEMLTTKCKGALDEQPYFDGPSVDLIYHFLEWATYDEGKAWARTNDTQPHVQDVCKVPTRLKQGLLASVKTSEQRRGVLDQANILSVWTILLFLVFVLGLALSIRLAALFICAEDI